MPKAVKVPVPNGTYAVPDPHDSTRLTLWLIVEGKPKPWPPNSRWAPFPPAAPEGMTYRDRADWRQDWYDSTYFPWRDAVFDAIVADPETAALAFDAEVPAEDRPSTSDFATQKPKKTSPRRIARPAPAVRKNRRRTQQERTAAGLHAAGSSYRLIALALGVTRMTAWRRVQAGKAEHEALMARVQGLAPIDPLAHVADHFARLWSES